MTEPQPQNTYNNSNQGPVATAGVINGPVSLTSNHYNSTTESDVPDTINFRCQKPENDFTGRPTELEKLKSDLPTTGVIVISGMGGVGKTQLARKFIVSCVDEYRNNIWIDSEKQDNIETAFRQLAKDYLKLKTMDANGEEKNSTSIIEQVLEKLCKRKTLFVYDNVDSHEILTFILAMALPSCGEKPHIIITSRLKTWPDRINVLGLNVWTVSESIDFISKVLGNNDPIDDRKVLAEMLQNFPLALRQATAYIRYERDIDDFKISDYVEEFRSTTTEILNSTTFQKQSLTPYQKTTYTTWIITIKTIENDETCGQFAIKVLHTMAYFLPDNIDRSWFLNMPRDDTVHQANDRKRKRHLHSAIELLVGYSMIDSKDKILSIHRLVQNVIRLKLKETNKEREILRDALSMLSKERELSYVARNHKVSVFESASEFPDLINELSTPTHIETMSLIASCYMYKKKHNDALHLLQQLLEHRRADLGDHHPDTVMTKYGVAEVLTKLGLHSDAHQLLEEIYEWKKETCGDDNVDTLRAMHIFGASLYKQGRWEDALKLHEDVHEKRKTVLGEYHPHTLMTKHNIAMSLHRLGRIDEALQKLQEICETKEKFLGCDHPETLRTKSKIAQQFASLGQHRNALELYRDIHEKRKKVLGENHLDTLSTKMKMAVQYGELREQKESIRLLEELHQSECDVLGVDHIATLRTKSRIAEQLAKLGRHKEALELLQNVLVMQTNKWGSDRTETLKIKQLIAAQHRDMEHRTEALQLYQEIFDKQKQILGENHHDTMKTKSDIDSLSREEHQSQKRALDEDDAANGKKQK